MSEKNNLFPIFLKAEQLKFLLVGGGNVALEKLEAILRNSPSANINIIAKEVKRKEIIDIVNNNPAISLKEKSFEPDDLQGAEIVMMATDSRELHIEIRNLARQKNLLVNVADTPDLCDFYLGSTVTKGSLKIGISTNGKSPTLSKRMRQYLEETIPEDIDDLINKLVDIRQQLKGDFEYKVNQLNDITASWLDKKKDDQ
ncbi:precorrin-2 dehydrogenase/sirohydrochlorin ferrochelatase family protein [Marinigracilibium pacificum]|uniref:precorrin-2 dehydrogenase n=1 Tax=Marinigracilibium pacificum TaxID=2729599 RepID=A0A848J1W7_9BACT|nr:bifunctional precorrin-2 dehydrogenase/sirohydrochlorin ferrochelatase [Marinigracilibium pacificum]NMM47192.1 bifunctional precorrin-2 dehydrogenase/sirohydrochlorin ferrochelatase [Marinigracilibium pacificum]